MKKPTPINIYVSILKDGKIAISEYIRAKRRNILEPFKPTDTISIGRVAEMIQRCQRPVELRAYTMGAANELQILLNDFARKQASL